VRLYFLLTVAAALLVQAREKIPVVLSTDVGNEVDDQWTITYLLTHPRFEVLGIASAHAPSLRPPAGRTSFRILQDAVENRLGFKVHPPLYAGADEPLTDTKTAKHSEAVEFLLQVSRGFTSERRLTVLTIGAATDVASALIRDPQFANRVRVVQMGYQSWTGGGQEFNIQNDPVAARVLLDSDVPLAVGAGDVCRRDLALSLEQAKTMLAGRGPVAEWLWEEFDAWYWRHVKPMRRADFSKPWIIWDNVVLAHVLGMTESEERPRPRMAEDLKFEPGPAARKITWITRIDGARMWADFLSKLDTHTRTHGR
jgi:purine nucleosidase